MAGERILVVDDEAGIRELIQLYLIEERVWRTRCGEWIGGNQSRSKR